MQGRGCQQQHPSAVQSLQARPRRCPVAAAAKGPAATGPSQQRQQQQAADPPPPAVTLAQRLGRLAATGAAAAALALGATPDPAAALLNSPNAQIPRTAEAALRRSIPAFNRDVRGIQGKLEGVAFKLRIPQRKPWQSMSDDVALAAEIAADGGRMMAGVLPQYRERAEGLLADIRSGLGRLGQSLDVKDSDRTSIRLSNVLEQVGQLELVQAPGLPYQLPRQVSSLPLLTGRAVVELTVERADRARVFIEAGSDAGPQQRGKLRLIVDGYSAPVTAGNFVARCLAGQYNAVPLSASPVAVLAGQQQPGSNDLDPSPAAALPLEILPAGDFEPQYRVPLDVRSGELPVLPLSIYGSVAMAHLLDSSSGYVSSSQWFISKFDKTQAGLAGLSFDEGEFGVFGYVVQGLDALNKLGDGDKLLKAEVVEGADKLIMPASGSGEQLTYAAALEAAPPMVAEAP